MQKGVIQLHGANVMFQNEDVTTPIPVPPFYKTRVLPGDQVSFDTTTQRITLLHRQPQRSIGVVASIKDTTAYLRFPLFGQTCPFLHAHICATRSLGDRFVVRFEDNGEIHVEKQYTANAKEDIPLLLDVYQPLTPPSLSYIKTHTSYYTKLDIIDHNNLDTFTIDPATSVDFDDAISVDVEKATVYIHIVDIIKASQAELERLHSYVSSLYLANEHTEHLLEHRDTVQAFSLVKGEERPVITVACKMNGLGEVVSYDIYRSTIVVKHRYNYEEVADALTAGTAPNAIQWLATLSEQRNKDVSYSLQLPSLALTVNKESGLLSSVKHAVTNDVAHTLVATAMILCNIVVSKHLADAEVKLPNRFHEKLRGFRQTNELITTGNPHVDSFVLVKRYARAYYSIDSKGHFGLGLTDYVHFTSPMRRYADVIVHMLLAGYHFNNLEDIVKHINHRSFLCRSIQGYYEDCKIGRYMQNNLVPYDVWITDVKPAGLLWFCPAMNRNGFAHVSTLKPACKWSFSDETLVSPDFVFTWKLGTRVKGMVSSVDPTFYTVNMSLGGDTMHAFN